MNEFKDFLLDYEMKEKEEVRRGLSEQLTEGKLERYPPLCRFVKASEPLARVGSQFPVWGVIPFYGSTVLRLMPVGERKDFDNFYGGYGFTSKNFDELIEFIKQTGRLQFVLSQKPTAYQDMEFLRPILEELRPPLVGYPLPALIGPRRVNRYLAEFDALAKLGLEEEIALSEPPVKSYPRLNVFRNLRYFYALISAFGEMKLIQDIKDAMVNEPTHAYEMLGVVGCLYLPLVDPLKPTSNYSLEDLVETRRILGRRKSPEQGRAVYEIGAFILNKMINYPTTMDGCYRIIQEYEDNQLLQVSQALHKGVKERKIDVVKTKSKELSTILDNVWKDAKKVGRKRDLISGGVSTLIGLMGELASTVPGFGILAALGFQTLDRYTGLRLSERLAKTISPNYLVTVYDFQRTLSAREPNPKS